MTRIEQIEADIQQLQEVLHEAKEVIRFSNTRSGKALIKSFQEGRDAATHLTINANESLSKQGVIGVQAYAWMEQHLDYKRQIADQAEAQIQMLREELLAPVEEEAELNTGYEG